MYFCFFLYNLGHIKTCFFQYLPWAKSWFTELSRSVTCIITVSEGQPAFTIEHVCRPDRGCVWRGGFWTLRSLLMTKGARRRGRHSPRTFGLWEYLELSTPEMHTVSPCLSPGRRPPRFPACPLTSPCVPTKASTALMDPEVRRRRNTSPVS